MTSVLQKITAVHAPPPVLQLARLSTYSPTGKSKSYDDRRLISSEAVALINIELTRVPIYAFQDRHALLLCARFDAIVVGTDVPQQGPSSHSTTSLINVLQNRPWLRWCHFSILFHEMSLAIFRLICPACAAFLWLGRRPMSTSTRPSAL
ncbi:hypothetical protein BCR34DRAFT_574494 [Clohesyomyces aquaticus]|uniref:Uncharacterized protein n=1 Tax=Clohesyomyces aquaticus TaxID=1231657 RepID=A0A1Y1YVX5_9PLEO|nr:hypothetical protein BCR34DRAFT_574494 [Clohesyomyces aquaticus]